MIPDKDNLNEISPVKLLVAMYEQNQTGILYFRQNELLKVFYLNQGKISWALSSDEKDKIEHILLAQKLISPEALAPYQTGNKISESFGKVLVENGLITLETLINAIRDQLTQIAVSVLRWSSGNYQLERESPPTRLVSLEMEIPSLVYNYILTQMDINIVWEELGSLSGELQQTRETEKSFQYILDAEQQEVYACFREPQRPEAVMLQFAAERKYTILKILYFFLLTGLLVKKEAEALPTMDFNELDSLFGQDQPESATSSSIEVPAIIHDTDIKDIPILDLPDIPDANAGTGKPVAAPPELNPPTASRAASKPARTPLTAKSEKTAVKLQPLMRQEKQKPKWQSITFLSVLLAAVLIGLFLWLTRTPDFKETETAGERPATKTARKNPARQAAAASAQNDNLPAANASSGPTAVQTPANGASLGGDVDPQNKKQEDSAAGGKTMPLDTTEKSLPAGKEIVPVQTFPIATAGAQQAFAAQDFETAGKLWQQEMRSGKITHSILLEMDCLKQSVQLAFEQISDKENFFILNRSKDGRNCYLVLWGKYRTPDEASLGMRLVPEYFMKQGSPPSVIELEPYL